MSAVCVYHEVGGPGVGKGQPLSTQAVAELKRLGGKDARDLLAIGASRGLGIVRPTPGEAASVGNVTAPGALLAALDLGPGPIALFVTLLAGAAAFALGRALRRRRNAA